MKRNWIFIIIITLMIGIFGFIIFKNKKFEISTNSYDWGIEFSLGKYRVDSYSCNNSDNNYGDPLTVFSFDSEEREATFLTDVLSRSEYISIVDFSNSNNFNYTYYMFLYQGYYFVLYKNVSGDYVLTPMYSFYTMTIDEVTYSYRFSFPIYTAFQDNNLIHDNLSMTFEDLVEYYSELPNNEVVFDIENKEIHLQGFSIFSQTKTEDYPIHIIWNVDGYTVEMVREE